MYSLILMTATATAPQAAEFNGYFRNLFAFRGGCDGQTSRGCYGTSACYGRGVFHGRIAQAMSFGGCGGCRGDDDNYARRPAGCAGASYSCCGATAYACNGTAYACYGASASCVGGHADPGGMPYYGGQPPGMPYGGSTYPGSPMMPMTDGVPFAPNTPAPPPVIDTYRVPGAMLQGSPSRGTVVVKVPADAKLYAEGRPLTLTGAERTFVTPELPAGREYTYTFKIEYDRHGETVTQSKKVIVKPGATATAEFIDLVLAKAEPKPVDAPKPVRPTMDKAVPTSAERAKITLTLPPGATLYVDAAKQAAGEPVREFTTPPLPAGKEYAYQMTVEVVRGGLPETVTETVKVRAGERITRDFAAAFAKR